MNNPEDKVTVKSVVKDEKEEKDENDENLPQLLKELNMPLDDNLRKVLDLLGLLKKPIVYLERLGRMDRKLLSNYSKRQLNLLAYAWRKKHYSKLERRTFIVCTHMNYIQTFRSMLWEECKCLDREGLIVMYGYFRERRKELREACVLDGCYMGGYPKEVNDIIAESKRMPF